MKKKLIQILMLLVATVSVGSFVSCKDTNEDLYNELRTQSLSALDDESSLRAALDTRIGQAEGRITALETWRTTVIDPWKTTIDKWQGNIDTWKDSVNADLKDTDDSLTVHRTAIDALTAALQKQINDYNALIAALGTPKALDFYTQAEVKAFIDGLQLQIDNIKTALDDLAKSDALTALEANLKAADELIKKDIADLKTAVAEAKAASAKNAQDISKLAERVATLEATMKKVEEDVSAAMTTATAAKETANNALAIANTAKDNADKAIADAATALQKANDAALAAQGAAGDAAVAKTIAEAAQKAATDAATAANAANTLATQALTLAQANEKAIDTLREQLTNNTKELKDLIAKNKEDIEKNADAIGQNAAAILKNADAILKNATDIANYAEKIQENADAIKKLQEELSQTKIELSFASKDAKQALEAAAAAAAKADANKEAISKLSNTVNANKTNIEAIQKALDELKGTVSGIDLTQVEVNKTKIEALQKALDEAKTSASELATKYDEMSKELNSLKAELGTLKAQTAADLEAAKDQIKTEIALAQAETLNKVNELIKDLATTEDLEDLEEKLGDYATKDQLNDLKKLIEGLASQSELDKFATKAELEKAIGEVLAKVAENSERIKANETDIKWIKELLTALNTKVDNLETVTPDDLERWAEAIKASTNETIANTRADILKEVIDMIQKSIDGIDKEVINNNVTNNNNFNVNIVIGGGSGDGTGITEEEVKAIVAVIEASINAKLEALEANDEALQAQIDALTTKINDNIAELLKLKIRVALLESTTVKIGEYTLDKIAIYAQIDANKCAIGKIKSDIETITSNIEELKSEVNGLKTRMNEAETKLNEIAPKVDALTKSVSAINDNLGKMVTGITVQGTYNPMFGSFSLPTGTQSNMLVAYWGKPTHKITFPTTDDSYYSKASKGRALTEADWSMIEDGLKNAIVNKNMLLMNEDNGKANAGKIYMTVNPNTVDFDGLKFDLVNSQDNNTSYVELTNIKKSNATLQFGFGRAANNGFYEADAYIDRAKLTEATKVEIDEKRLEEIGMEVRQKMAQMSDNFFNGTSNSGDLGTIATKTYEILREMKLDQNALKCTYKTADAEGVETEHSVYSQYNVAATAIKPLTLQSFKDVHYYTIPGYEGVHDFMLNKIGGILKNHVSYLFKKANESWKVQKIATTLNVDFLKFIDATKNLVARWDARVSGFTLNGESYTLTIPGTGSVDILFDKTLGGTFDAEKVSLERASIVIYGTMSNMKAQLIIPAKGGDGVIAAYACLDLTNATVANNAGVIELTVVDGITGDTNTYQIASVAATGAGISTTGYASSLVLSNLKGTEGYVSLPVVLTITEEISGLLGSDFVKSLQAITNDMNETLAKINNYENVINGWIDSWVDKYLINYLNKINNTTVYFINSINRRFGPFMTASNGGKFKILSTTKEFPTVLNAADLRFYPTTKNMELIVPIARKHVAVTNVFKGDDSVQNGKLDKKLLTDVNSAENFNTVFDGTKRVLNVSGMVPGYIYEVAYSVLDFDGNIATTKYYVTVK